MVAVGGSDAHARKMTMGFIHRTIFPYEYHFSAINTHILTPQPLSGDISEDRKMVFSALEAGHCFIGYDLAGKTCGFLFEAQGKSNSAKMGDRIEFKGGVTLQIKLPSEAEECRLIRDGKVVNSTQGEALVHLVTQPGIYRVEAYKKFLGRKRGWIFSNPIYVD